MKSLLATIALITMSASAFAKSDIQININLGGHKHHDRNYDQELQHMSCVAQGAQNMLLNEDGMVLKTFAFETDCQAAAARQTAGFTCATDNANGTDLINSYSGSIYHFTFESDCMKSLPETESGLICAQDNANPAVLINSEGTQMGSFTFMSDCETARQQTMEN